jgi:hypothetical protein
LEFCKGEEEYQILKIFDKIMARIFLNLVKIINPKVQKLQQSPRRINFYIEKPHQSLKNSDKEENLKASRK